MKIFVAGASGVIGRRLVPMLIERGHVVVGMTRSEDRSGALRELGAEPVVCDVYNAERLRQVVAEVKPDAVIHELTDLPGDLSVRRGEDPTAGNDRIRVEGTRNLVDAALAAGARRMVAQSIAFAYALDGDDLKVEGDPLFDDAPFPWSRTIEALHSLEDAVTKTDGIDGTVLRYGFLYGPGSGYASDGFYAQEAVKRRLPLIGSADGVFSFVHVDDAAAATVTAVEGDVTGVFNIVDDEPAPAREWIPAYAEALGAKRPRHVPQWIAKRVAGPYAVMLMTQMRGASNAKAKDKLGWQPQHPSWRDGFKNAIG